MPERAHRRTFTAKYKLAILAAYDGAVDGEKGALLRREALDELAQAPATGGRGSAAP